MILKKLLNLLSSVSLSGKQRYFLHKVAIKIKLDQGFCDLDRLIPKFLEKCKEPRIALMHWKKKKTRNLA